MMELDAACDQAPKPPSLKPEWAPEEIFDHHQLTENSGGEGVFGAYGGNT